MNRVAIIGAGQFGIALAESLSESGVEVLLVERNGNQKILFTHLVNQLYTIQNV